MTCSNMSFPIYSFTSSKVGVGLKVEEMLSKALFVESGITILFHALHEENNAITVLYVSIDDSRFHVSNSPQFMILNYSMQ